MDYEIGIRLDRIEYKLDQLAEMLAAQKPEPAPMPAKAMLKK